MKRITIFVLYFLCWGIQAQDCSDQIRTGEGTYYGSIAGTSSGNCGLPIASEDYFYCAMNNSDYAGSTACGACVQVTGPKGTITLRVVDRCPECKPGDIDMSQQAFETIAELIDGRVPIRWQYVPCNVQQKGIKIHFKEGSSMFWTAIQFRDLNYAIATMEYKDDTGSWQEAPRALYNFFIIAEGLSSPMDLRLTSVNGARLVFNAINLDLQSDFDTQEQFSAGSNCSGDLPIVPVADNGTPLLYPNPAKDFFYIRASEIINYQLFTIHGVLVKSGVIAEEKKGVPVDYLPRGLYYLKIRNKAYTLVLGP